MPRFLFGALRAQLDCFASLAMTALPSHRLIHRRLEILEQLQRFHVAERQDLRRIEPVYETLSGWQTSTVGTTDLNSLPVNARRYVDFLSEKIGVEIGLVSTGPERSQTIVVEDSAVGGWLND